MPASASGARIGLIVLASDFTIEHEWRAIFAALPGVALYESRLFNDPIVARNRCGRWSP